MLPALREGASALLRDLPELTGCRLCAERTTSQDSPVQGFEVHVDLRFPERQLVLNRSGTIPKAVLRDALAAARALAGADQEHRHRRVAHDVLGVAA